MTNAVSLGEKTVKIKNLMLEIRLGASDLERSFPQTVSINFKFTLFTAASADNLDHYLCYDLCITALKDFLSKNEYKTVEYLTEQVYSFINDYSSSIKNLELSVKKLNPPLSSGAGLESVKIKIRSKNSG